MSYLLAIDQGTTSSRALLVSESGEVIGVASKEFKQHYPKPGWVEHDVEEIWSTVGYAVREVLKETGKDPRECRGIGITNQRETTVIWDRKTRKPVHNAIVWQDRRTTERCAELKRAGQQERFSSRTGLVLDPYFSGTKIAWILDNVSGTRADAQAGKLAFGTIDSWLVNRLSGGAVHVTDATNASRTLLYNIIDRRWDDELCAVLNVPKTLLPEVRSCSEVYAKTSGLDFLPDGIPIAGMAGDQQAALFGQTCFDRGEAKCTYGTGAFLLMNTANKPVHSRHGLITTIAWQLGDDVTYALEGSAFVAGAAVQWLRDGLGLIGRSADVEALAEKVPSSGDVVFVPALAGLGAPYWDPEARGLICGLTRDTTAAHIARATLEGIAFQISDLVTSMESDAGHPLARLRVDGGAAQNRLLMQFQADMLKKPIDRPKSVETTALGAAYLAGLATGVFDALSSIKATHRIDASFNPSMGEEMRAQHLRRWKKAVRRTESNLGCSI